MKKMKLFEAMRECGRHIWLCETNQITYNEIELQQLRIIEENILVYLETALQNKRNHNSDKRKLISSSQSLTPIDSDHTSTPLTDFR